MKKSLVLLVLCLVLALVAVSAFAEDGTDVVNHIEYRNQRDFKPLNGRQHEYTVDVYERPTHASKGPAGEAVMTGSETVVEEHVIENGVCTVCGFGEGCAHANTEMRQDRMGQECEPIDDTTHHTKHTRINVQVCLDCGLETELGTEPVDTTEAHRYNDKGQCWDCGYQCAHTNTSFAYDEVESTEIKGITAKTHTVVEHLVLQYVCEACQMPAGSETRENTYTENHDFDENDVCTVCGYQNVCLHPNTTENDIEYDWEYTIIDANKHHIKKTFVTQTVCVTCGQVLKESAPFVDEFDEPHYFENNECWCGQKAVEGECAHANTHEEFNSEVVSYEKIDANTHKLTQQDYTRIVCNACGTIIKETDGETSTIQEPHEYSNGVCSCGQVNACTHPNGAEVETQDYLPDSGTPLNASQHHVVREYYDRHFCPICGETLSWSNHRVEEKDEPHAFGEDGLCWICGYEQPATPVPYIPEVITTPAPTTRPATRNATTATVTAAPTEAPAEVMNIEFTEDTAVETLRGVDLANDVPAAEAIEALGESLEEEAKQGAVIEIVNLDLVLEADEMDALEELPVKEQLLVMLFAIGPTDFVDQDTALSEQAAQLVQSITERISKMTAAEKKAFEDLIALTFPVETIVIDGVAYDFFVIDVEIKDGDTDKVERYGFRKDDDGQWILTQLNLGVLA